MDIRDVISLILNKLTLTLQKEAFAQQWSIKRRLVCNRRGDGRSDGRNSLSVYRTSVICLRHCFSSTSNDKIWQSTRDVVGPAFGGGGGEKSEAESRHYRPTRPFVRRRKRPGVQMGLRAGWLCTRDRRARRPPYTDWCPITTFGRHRRRASRCDLLCLRATTRPAGKGSIPPFHRPPKADENTLDWTIGQPDQPRLVLYLNVVNIRNLERTNAAVMNRRNGSTVNADSCDKIPPVFADKF